MQGSLNSETGIMSKTGEIFGERVNETGEKGFGGRMTETVKDDLLEYIITTYLITTYLCDFDRKCFQRCLLRDATLCLNGLNKELVLIEFNSVINHFVTFASVLFFFFGLLVFLVLKSSLVMVMLHEHHLLVVRQ